MEFAFCAPVFFVLIFAGIEIARVNMLMQTVDSACVQAVRRGIIPGASASDVKSVAEETLEIANIDTHTVTVTPSVITANTDEVTVTISIPISTNGYVMPGFFGGKSISQSLTFTRE